MVFKYRYINTKLVTKSLPTLYFYWFYRGHSLVSYHTILYIKIGRINSVHYIFYFKPFTGP